MIEQTNMLKLAIKVLVNSELVASTALKKIQAPLIIQFIEGVNQENIVMLAKYVKEVKSLKEEDPVIKKINFKDDVVLTEIIYDNIEIEKDMLMLIPFCTESSVSRYTKNILETKNILNIIDFLERWNEEASASFLFMSNFFTQDSKPILYELTNGFKKQKNKLAEASKLLKKAIDDKKK